MVGGVQGGGGMCNRVGAFILINMVGMMLVEVDCHRQIANCSRKNLRI